jgi:hypothetical protein
MNPVPSSSQQQQQQPMSEDDDERVVHHRDGGKKKNSGPVGDFPAYDEDEGEDKEKWEVFFEKRKKMN